MEEKENNPINIAVICQKYSNFELVERNAPIQLREIDITLNIFKYIFYETDSFNINPSACINFNKYISLLPASSSNPDGRYKENGIPFSLLAEIYVQITQCLKIPIEAIDTTSRITLNKEISSIKSLCNLNCQSLVNSLRWSDIQNIVLADPLYKYDKPLRLAITLVFASSTECVDDLVVIVNYNITGLQEMANNI